MVAYYCHNQIYLPYEVLKEYHYLIPAYTLQ